MEREGGRLDYLVVLFMFSGKSPKAGGMRLMGRDDIRYQYEHSILPYDDTGSVWDGEQLSAGHRVSVMVRVSLLAKLGVISLTSIKDAPPRPAQL